METYLGFVYGLRSYEQAYRNAKFLTGGYGIRWYSPRQNARCKYKDSYSGACESAPCELHHSGINAYSIEAALENRMLPHYGRDQQSVLDSLNGYGTLIALTKLWGEIIVTEHGYRAQKAEVIMLFGYQRYPLPYGWRDVPVRPNFKLDFIRQYQLDLTQIPEQEG